MSQTFQQKFLDIRPFKSRDQTGCLCCVFFLNFLIQNSVSVLHCVLLTKKSEKCFHMFYFYMNGNNNIIGLKAKGLKL